LFEESTKSVYNKIPANAKTDCHSHTSQSNSFVKILCKKAELICVTAAVNCILKEHRAVRAVDELSVYTHRFTAPVVIAEDLAVVDQPAAAVVDWFAVVGW
jgi:hypothetical protein